MRVGFSRPTSTEEERRLLFTGFREVGYDGLQLKAGQYREYVDSPERFVEEWGPYPGVASGVIAGGALDDDGVARLRKLFGFAESVGCERVVFCHTVPRRQVGAEDIRRFARLLSELGKEAFQSGVRLSLHHHYDQPVMHREDLDLFFGSVEQPYVGLTVDTAHLVKSGVGDVAGVIRDFADFVDNVHLKDLADGEFRVLGRGDIDFAPIFSAIREIGFDGWVCADEESGSELVGAMSACYWFITSGLSGTRRGQEGGSRERS